MIISDKLRESSPERETLEREREIQLLFLHTLFLIFYHEEPQEEYVHTIKLKVLNPNYAD